MVNLFPFYIIDQTIDSKMSDSVTYANTNDKCFSFFYSNVTAFFLRFDPLITEICPISVDKLGQ